MSAWIMSVVGVICLGVLLEIVLPSGKSTKYIKGAFSLLVVFAIASIIPTIAKAEWTLNVDDMFSKNDASVSTGLDLTLKASERVRLALKNEGCDSSVEINYNGTVAMSVWVYVEKTKISGEKIVAIASETLNVSKNIVRVIYSEF